MHSYENRIVMRSATAFPLTISDALCYKEPFPKKEVRMASIQQRVRLALFVALCQLLSPLHSHPLQAQEKAVQKNQKEVGRPDEGDGGVEGLASYYAIRYNGRKTLSGTRYRPEGLTAASPDLPLGCMVKVINLENAKEVLVTVNDRCHRRKTPFIDLSRDAAKKLGFLGAGTARVRIIALKDDES
jgi:rare lipoprotein A